MIFMAESLREEFLELLGDVRERLAFARELGLEGLQTDFTAEIIQKPEQTFQPKTLSSAAPKTITNDEAFVPEARKSATSTTANSVGQPTRRGSLSNLLEQTKMSKISSAVSPVEAQTETLKPAAPIIAAATDVNQNLSNKSEGKKMDGNSLFGDLAPEKETLPESNETHEEIRADIGDCVRCPLYQGRTKIVHTTGNWQSRVLFVGEAPGANEDAEGKPFVGRAGQLLTKIIEAIGLKREEVLIGNVNRCRPPQNRTPTIQEARTCRQFLMREIAVARPEVIVVMGNTATQNLLDTKEGITKLRGKFQDYYGVKVMPTFHPAYLLRDPSKKRETWEDMKIVRDELAKTAR
jgi:DNA polymerase